MTELLWEGKYKDDKKCSPVKIALPFQTIETVNESSVDREKRIASLFHQKEESTWFNRLIWGDKKYVLPSLLTEFAGKINLIYIDPPFDTGADFSFNATIPDNPSTEENETATFLKQPSIIEQKAYRDTWGKGLDSYLQWFYDTIIFLRDMLSDNGGIYVHLDWHVGQYAKVILDDIFGYSHFRNEIVWQKTLSRKAQSNSFGNMHDIIYFYSKSEDIIFNQIFEKRDEETTVKRFPNIDEKSGKRYVLDNFTQAGQGPARSFGNRGSLAPPPGKHWIWTQEKIDEGLKNGLIKFTKNNMPRLVRFETEGLYAGDIWSSPDLMLHSQSKEDVGYPTQKPEALLERIIKVTSNKDDLILDCFCGSGTTAAVAEKLNRRWIACDLGRFAIHTTRKRLLGIQNIKPFIVQNLGKYERQQWLKAEFEDTKTHALQDKSYKNFIIELYNAKPIEGYIWLHGAKAGRMIHVGSVDSPVSVGDIKSIILEFKKLVGKSTDIRTNGIDVLGWDFAFDVNETASQFAAANNVDVKFKKIPREVLEPKAVEQGDIQFFELAALDIGIKTNKLNVKLELKNFIIPFDDVPEEARKAITHWSQFVDYWAIDWNYKNDTFHNEWQSYRTKKNPSITLLTEKNYESPGSYSILVKVIDILGNDTTKAINIEINSAPKKTK